MNDTTKIETTSLPQTTFGAAAVDAWYVTTRGHRVLVVEVCDDHAIVESRSGKQMRVAADQVAFGPEVQDVVEQPVEAADKTPGAARPNVLGAKTRGRDPHLPDVGTEITRKWRDHAVVARENPIGDFGVWLDDEFLGNVKSLTAAASMVLAKEGITSGVNGFAWFRIGQPTRAPRASRAKSIEHLQADVARLQERFTRAAEIAARLEGELEVATEALATARAEVAAA